MDVGSFAVLALLWIVGVVFLLTLCLTVVVYRLRDKQNYLLYFPEVPPGSTTVCETPLERGFRNSEQVHIRTADGLTLRGFIMWPPAERQEQSRPTLHCADGEGVGFIFQKQPSTDVHCAYPYPLTTPGYASPAKWETAEGAQAQHAILYFHGNAGNVGQRIPIAAMLAAQCRCAVLMVDYRGYGRSDPVAPTQEGLMLDAQACLDYLLYHPRIPSDRIFVMGTSLGGAVAIHLASEPHNAKHIAGVIVENTFTCIGDMASDMFEKLVRQNQPRCSCLLFRLFEYCAKPLFLHIKWRSIDVVQNIRAPMLFLSGLKDDLVPPEQMRRLYSRTLNARSRKFVEYRGGNHNGLAMMPGYSEELNNFVKDVLLKREQLV